jgi:hypothetical protein
MLSDTSKPIDHLTVRGQVTKDQLVDSNNTVVECFPMQLWEHITIPPNADAADHSMVYIWFTL